MASKVEHSASEGPTMYGQDVRNDASEGWRRCTRVLEQHSDQLVYRWKAEIDMSLVFAGLFSAVLTAFIVESYELLQPDQGEEILNALKMISSQLNGFTISSPFVNATVMSNPSAVAPFTPPRYAVWLNTLWFSALICSLSASSIAITVRQWLHQYTAGVSGDSPEMARVRQYRYESLLRWHVGAIIAALPILLQSALALFLAGLLGLLYSLHPVVAGVSSVLIGMLALLWSATIVSHYVHEPKGCVGIGMGNFGAVLPSPEN
ncbi:hypothetical protein C8Q74DRAFT_1369429 [Fomes fomentarius]|nr:hypothetical protein C8Q74DRAFT_1369429 [Fomes fomentarius]